jgi:hypothetical protein
LLVVPNVGGESMVLTHEDGAVGRAPCFFHGRETLEELVAEDDAE